MHIQLSDHFTYRKLLRFTLPSIAMMIFTSIYGVVDGFFVSNYVGKTPFAAVNLVMPFLMILGSVGFMFGAGGSALIAKSMGEGRLEKARSLFSLFVYAAAVLGIIISVGGALLLRPVCRLMGAEGELLEACVTYGMILLISLPFFILQFEFQSFFIAAEKPHLGLAVTVVSGVCNMVCDWLLMGILNGGLIGAALATALSQVLGAVAALVYFARPQAGLLHLGRTQYDGRAMIQMTLNGSSELMSNLSMSIVGMLYNAQLLLYAGEDGVAAYGVLMYINFIFLSAFIGFANGSAPVVSFHYGAQNRRELQGLFKRSLTIISLLSVGMCLAGEALAHPLSALFVSYDEALMEMTVWAFRIYSISFLMSGVAIYGSSFFTALNDGLTSALISFLRSLVFQVAAVMLFPLIWGLDGIWFSIVAAELMAALLTILFFVIHRKKYHYY